MRRFFINRHVFIKGHVMCVTTHEMFMLFFSILYGIMLNAAIGLEAFPVARALASLFKKNKSDEDRKSLVRLITAVLIFNISPFVYFAVIFHYLKSALIPSINLCVTISQILIIGLLSMSVFGFYRLYHCIILIRWRCDKSLLYTKRELMKLKKKRGLCMNAKAHLVGFILYFVLPISLGLMSSFISLPS